MQRLSDSEWKVLSALWQEGRHPLGQIYDALHGETGWSRTTVHTYLKRMGDKGLVTTDQQSPKGYFPAISREEAMAEERQGILSRASSPGSLVAAFVRDGALSAQEREDLRKLLDDMEV